MSIGGAVTHSSCGKRFCVTSPLSLHHIPSTHPLAAVAMETSSHRGKWQFVIAGRRQACEAEQMSLLLSRGLFVRVTLETEIFQFPVRHLEPIMACHVFPRHRCAAATASVAAGLTFLHNHYSTAFINQRHALAKHSTPTKGGILWAFRSEHWKKRWSRISNTHGRKVFYFHWQNTIVEALCFWTVVFNQVCRRLLVVYRTAEIEIVLSIVWEQFLYLISQVLKAATCVRSATNKPRAGSAQPDTFPRDDSRRHSQQ